MAHYELRPGVVAHCQYLFDHIGPHGIGKLMPPINVPRPSVASLLLEGRKAGAPIGTATGFIVERESARYLVTNRHVVRGEGILPGAALLPQSLVIEHHVAGKF